MTVWISSGGFSAKNLTELLAAARSRGVVAIELSSGLAAGPGVTEDLQSAMTEGMHFLVHNYFPAPEQPFVLNIAAEDPANRSQSVQFAKRAIDIATAVEAPFYSIHAGFAVALRPGDLGRPDVQRELVRNAGVDRDAALTRMQEAVNELADYASTRGLRLLLENNVVSPHQLQEGLANPLLLTDPAETASFFRSLKRNDVGLLLDVAHARVAGAALDFDPALFFETCQPWIEALHLSDNDGLVDNNRPFSEESWFFPKLRDFADLPFVVEVYKMDQPLMEAQLRLAEKVQNG